MTPNKEKNSQALFFSSREVIYQDLLIKAKDEAKTLRQKGENRHRMMNLVCAVIICFQFITY
ncbi:hypothetical protein ES332_D07G152700v1 [Gossypium tomentosum]|uniref:Uncharacterized protein n=1 Tax=Gossypium tomentosum TaxID=34277 RepID=A0A5D2K8F6_GOSTO|nr:hypothetical protein ES332_D07G152700v1 [Gossypium tomentosum]